MGLADWDEYLDLAKDAVEVESQLWDSGDEQLRAALYRQFAMSLSQGYFLYFVADPNYPDFVPFENSAFLAQPNPDAVYHYSAIDGAGVYRITGRRGTVPVMGFATGANLFGMSEPPGPGYDNYDADALALDADGNFEVILSAERPEGYGGDWRYLNPSTQLVIVRQFSYDWVNEVDGRLAIERLDIDYLRPPMSAVEVDNRLRALFGQYVRGLSRVCLGYMSALRARQDAEHVHLQSFDGLGNGEDWPQAYWECLYDLEPGEALVLETDLPDEHTYWNVQVIDALWNQVDILHRHSSINGFQAQLSSDGKFRAVLCPQDPGVPNWLDTGGGLRGMMIGRWYRCSSHPVPTVKKVALSELSTHLPADTPKVTHAARAEALRLRRTGAQLRRRW
ncbi:DUF1214 domain-containing protein [Mycobacterium paraseoulense]|uniref:DUF1214 domain-containing protein n=1 Tax=Mycobacterium paraseoulense TaxID=590652 RepID=A0A1X0IEW7_9MYCO|nr:DUF1214 domain-containing protein [Mycobacterium paraseoulense]MCV7393822.1 DUF1214 domain-containing protein [Mycobacterium paraseoulense]ORB45446.1 hypothetical protein BST39_04300 [Mycobacterium paraseoulense]BBZ70559.1 hypothetical protein MPRS_16520 [Mycobacterium paraseoulense]